MKIKVKQNSKSFRKSRIRLLIYRIKQDKGFIWYIYFYILIFICWILNNLELIKIFPETIDMLAFVLGMATLSMVLYTFFNFIFKVHLIYKDSKTIFEDEIAFDFTNLGIKIIYNGVYDYLYDWKDFKSFILLKDILYIIPKCEDDPLITINKEQLVAETFNSIIDFLELKLPKIV